MTKKITDKRIFLITAMRVGSTWIWDCLTDLTGYGRIFIEGPNIKQMRRSAGSAQNVVIKGHLPFPWIWIENIAPFSNAKFIGITRNIYDTLVSKSFLDRYSPGLEATEIRKRLEKEVDANINNDKAWVKIWLRTFAGIEHIRDIVAFRNYKHPKYMTVSYENMIKNPVQTIKTICVHLDVNAPTSKINEVIDRQSFERKSSRKNGVGINTEFRRIGIVNDYKNWLDSEDINYIQNIEQKYLKDIFGSK